MSKVDHETKARIDAFTDEQLERKVDQLKHTIPQLNAELDYAARLQRDRRHAAARKVLEDARRADR